MRQLALGQVKLVLPHSLQIVGDVVTLSLVPFILRQGEVFVPNQ